MKKNRLKSTLLATAIFSMVSGPAQANAPVIDFANLTESITGTIASMENWAREKALKQAQMAAQEQMGMAQIDNENNVMANNIVRRSKENQTIQNKEIEEMMAPDKDVCSNVGLNFFESETDCYIETAASEKTADINEDNQRYDLNTSQSISHRQDVMQTIIDHCHENIVPEGNPEEGDVDQAAIFSACTKAGSLMGAGTEDTLQEHQADAAENQIRLMVDPIPNIKQSNKMTPGTKGFNEARLNEFREDAFKSLVTSSMSEVNKWYQPVSSDAPVSRMKSFQMFVDERNNPDWVMSVGGGQWKEDESEGDSRVYRTELLKKMTVMEAKQTQIQLEQFKNQLRRETLQAASLALDINPL